MKEVNNPYHHFFFKECVSYEEAIDPKEIFVYIFLEQSKYGSKCWFAFNDDISIKHLDINDATGKKSKGYIITEGLDRKDKPVEEYLCALLAETKEPK